ncbi:hypothetical protein Tdes44962_MAKER05979 [Teratosphaeria destructans]|uniref:Zn(2)-C6 fungal-type domain-containing protein n=1 Tax=Teratosphaeria destructans TaxID=418781 RepID=A0A9W7VYE3_9PEZI|nr:hypothetical protein Tdes44962_MAKER05979 [Teratosphaeria destructans]
MDVDAVPGAIVPDLSQVSVQQPGGRRSVRSCLTCSKAKAKCVKKPGTTICERYNGVVARAIQSLARCSRLKKDCSTREPSIRKRKSTKTSRAAQLEQLENKIEHLVNALSASQNSNSQPSPPSSVSDNGPSQRSTSQQEVIDSLCIGLPESRDDCSILSNVRHSVTSATLHTSSPHNSLQVSRPGLPTISSNDYDQLGVGMHEAELLLARWRRLMAPMFPFVVVPEGVTARQLKNSKPLLLHTIVTVAYFHDLTKQQVMVKQLTRNVSERILINNEKNLGILQSLLVFVSWYHPHIFWGQQVTNLLHLAMSMILELGFDHAPGSCSDFKGATAKAMAGPNSVHRVPTLEEHRVLLGTFYLASMLGSSFKKMDSPKWTKYMTACLDNLVQAREYDSDLLLVQLVRLQHLAEDITQIDASATTPVQLYAKAFEAELNHIKQSDPCVNRMPEDQQLRMQYLTTEIFIWEVSLRAVQENEGEGLRDHIEGLHRCVSAIKAYIDEYFALPIDSYLTLPFSTFGQCAHAFITLKRIASLEVDGWDFAECNNVDFPAMVERAAVHYEGVARSRPDGLQVHNECFARWAHRLRWMKGVYEAKFSKPQPDATAAVSDQNDGRMFNGSNYVQAPTTASSVDQQQPTPPDEVMWSGEKLSNFDGDFWDEDFWNSFGSEYNMSFQPDVQMQMGYQPT